MSNTALNWAYSQTAPSGIAKSVLVYLANCASDETASCYPSVETICKNTQFAEKPVRRALRELKASELLEIRQRFLPTGRCQSNLFVLPIATEAAPLPTGPGSDQVNGHDLHLDPEPYPGQSTGVEDTDPGQSTGVNGVEGAPTLVNRQGATLVNRQGTDPGQSTGVNQREDTKDINLVPPLPPHGVPPQGVSERPDDLSKLLDTLPAKPAKRATRLETVEQLRHDPDFQTFWRLYPRKVKIDRAAQMFAKRVQAGTPAAVIIAGLQRHKFTDQAQYIPHPATWLNDGQWADEAEPGAWDWLDNLTGQPSGTWDGTTIDGEAIHAARTH